MRRIMSRTAVLVCVLCVFFWAATMPVAKAIQFDEGTVNPANCVLECKQGEPITPFRITLYNAAGYEFKKSGIFDTNQDYANLFTTDTYSGTPLRLSDCGLTAHYIERTTESVTFEFSGTPTAPLQESMTLGLSLGKTNYYSSGSHGVVWPSVLTVKITPRPAPQTGDTQAPWLWLGGALVSVAGISLLLILRRKKNALE